MTKKTKIKSAITDKALIFPNNSTKTTKQKNYRAAAGWLNTYPDGSSYLSCMSNGDLSTVKIQVIMPTGETLLLNNFFIVENRAKEDGSKTPGFYLEFNLEGTSTPKPAPSLTGWISNKDIASNVAQMKKPKFRANKADASENGTKAV